MKTARKRTRQLDRQPRTTSRSAASRLREAEALFSDFTDLTPYRYRPFVRMFDSYEECERWRRAQTNPWYR